MTMDLFYQCVEIKEKERIHFNEFMLGIQSKIHKTDLKAARDPLVTIAEAYAQKTRLLCLDEFQVS